MSRRRRLVRVGLAAITASVGVAVGLAGPAGAGVPLLVDDDDPVPVVVDGDAAVAVHGTVREPGGEVGVDLRHEAGDTVRVTVLVPDRAPEADRPTQDVLELEVTTPSGEVLTETAGPVLGPRTEGAAPGSDLRVLEWSTPAEAGTYQVRVRSAVPTRVVVATGSSDDVPVVEGYAGPGQEALAAWYETPAGADRASALDEAATEAGAGVQRAPGERGPSPDTGAGQRRDVIGRSAGWPLLVAVLAMMGFISLLALRPWRRAGPGRR